MLGFALGVSVTEAFWLEFLRSLVQPGLQGVQLVISDAHEGLKAAVAQVLSGTSWQRCRVHFTLAPAASAGVRNLLSHIPRRDQAHGGSSLENNLYTA